VGKSDIEFARVAISLSYITQDQAREALALLAKAKEMGLSETLPEVLLKKGYLTRAQLEAVNRALRQPRLSRIGKFQLLARVGQGGMGTVYKARMESLDKIVALKVLAPRLARQPDFVERFIREAQASGKLNHPNVVLGIDAGEADGYYYFAMEYVEGESLRQVLEREGKLPERQALEITAAIARALEHAHEHDIVHRDIKPGNIFIASDGTPKLGDLGLAKEIHTDKSITQAGIPVGTPYYISPEQARGQEDIDQRADIYALGATLYRMVAGQVPYDGPTGAIVMTKHLNDPIPDPRTTTPGLSEAVVAIIRRCMQKDRERRYQSATELREDIEAALAGQPLPHAGRAPGAARRRIAEIRARRRRRNIILAAAAACVVVAAVLAIALGRGGAASRPRARVPSTPARPQPPKPPPKATTSAPSPKTSVPTPKTSAPAPRAQRRPNPKKVLAQLVSVAEEMSDRAEVERLFADFIRKYANSPKGAVAVAEARTQLARLKSQWKAEDDFRKQVSDLLAQHKFAQARQALATPPFEPTSVPLAEAVQELKAKVQKAIADHLGHIETQGQELVRKGRLAEARKLYQEARSLAIPEAVEMAERALEKIAALEDARDRRLARTALAALLAKAAPLVKTGRFDEARGLFDPAQAPDNRHLAAMLRAARADIDRLKAYFQAVGESLAQRKSARVRGILRPIHKVENGIIHCAIGGSVPIWELTNPDLEELKLPQTGTIRPILELYRGDPSAAKAALAQLPDPAADPQLKHCAQFIECLEAMALEEKAQGLWAKANELAEKKQWKEAKATVESLLAKCADTAFLEQHRAQVRGLATRCDAEVAALIRRAETIKPFVDVTERAGDLSAAFKSLRPVGGWVIDINNDGLLDIALDIRRKKGDSPLVPIFFNRTKPGSREIAFEDYTQKAGLATGDEPICWADLDGDGDLDVVCRGLWTTAGGSRKSDHTRLALYENTGQSTPLFRLDPRRAIAPDPKESPSATGFGFGNIAVLDATGDGHADILAQFVGSVRTLSLFASVRGIPFRFADISTRVGFVVRKPDGVETADFLKAQAWPQYVVFDADGDNRCDLIFNADEGVLLANRGRRGFARTASRSVKYQTYASAETNNNPVVLPAVADYDNDGDMDIFVPQKGKNLLLRNDGGTFTDAMATTGPMATDAADSLWATWADVNDDGLLDLFICNANERNRLYIQKANHAFVDKAEEYGVTGEKSEVTNFAAFGDLDRDGDLDMVILRQNGRNQLLLNPYVTDQNRYYLNVLVRARVGTVGAKVYLISPPDKLLGLQQVCRVEGYNRQTPREAFFGVPAPGDYLVKVVLSNGREITKRATIRPDQRNRLVIK